MKRDVLAFSPSLPPSLTTSPPSQRIGAAGFSAGLQYFGRSVHGMMDVNEDGLVDLAVGALGAAVLIWLVTHTHPNTLPYYCSLIVHTQTH